MPSRARQIFAGLMIAVAITGTATAQRVDAEEFYGDWHLALLRDPISDELWPVAIVSDRQQPGTYLRFECRKRKLTALIELPEETGVLQGREFSIMSRFDGGAATSEQWVGGGQKMIYTPFGTEGDLLNRVLAAKRVSFRVHALHRPQDQDVEFNTEEAGEALGPLAKACGLH